MTPKEQLRNRLRSYINEKESMGLVISYWCFRNNYRAPTQGGSQYTVVDGMTIRITEKIWLNVVAPEIRTIQEEFKDKCQLELTPRFPEDNAVIVEWGFLTNDT